MPNAAVRPQSWPQTAFAPDSAVSLPGVLNTQNTATLAVTATSGRVVVNLNGAPQVELYNAGSSDCFIAFGDVTVAATVPATSSGSYPVPAGVTKIVTLLNPNAITNCAAICAGAGTTTLYVSPGVGAS